jgi:hypothetical protein
LGSLGIGAESALELEVNLGQSSSVERDSTSGIDWVAAGVAGFAAGAVMMVLELAWAASMSDVGPWRVTRLTAALVLGREATLGDAASHFSVIVTAVALVTHYALGIFSGLALAWILAAMHRFGQFGVAEAVGGAFGAGIYLVNFHLLTSIAPWFAELRGWGTFVLHIVFGLLTAVFYTAMSRRRQDSGNGAGAGD